MPDFIERAARVLALTGDYDGCFERLDTWESATPEQRECGEVEEPMLTDAEDAEWWRKRARALAAAGLLTPAGAAWHTDPPPGWSTFGAHAFMDEVPALEFWGEEYGGDGLPIWERPVPAPDADVAVCAWCPSVASGSALHNDGLRHPSCGRADHGQGWTHDPEGEDQ